MIDVQSQPGLNNIDIDKVGVSDVSYPIEVLDKKNVKQGTTASVNMYVDLPHQFKGTHMSRFIEVLNEYRGEITVRNMIQILKEIAPVWRRNPPIWSFPSSISSKRRPLFLRPKA